MTIKLNKIYAQLEAWRGERSNLTGPRHCERSEAIPFKIQSLRKFRLKSPSLRGSKATEAIPFKIQSKITVIARLAQQAEAISKNSRFYLKFPSLVSSPSLTGGSHQTTVIASEAKQSHLKFRNSVIARSE